MDLSRSFQDIKYGSSPTSSSSASSMGGGPFGTSISSRTGPMTDSSFPYFPPPFNPAFAAQFDVHAAAAASAMEHYPTFNYGTVNSSSSSYGSAASIHHQHGSPSSHAYNTGSYDPYASAYAASAAAARHHHSMLDTHHHHHQHAAELYSRHAQHHPASSTSLVDHTSRVSQTRPSHAKSLDVVQ